MEVGAFSGGDQNQTGLVGGGLHGGNEIGFQFDCHWEGILGWELLHSYSTAFPEMSFDSRGHSRRSLHAVASA